MNTLTLAVLGAVLGGFLYRCRGGFIGIGHTQLARLFYWAIPLWLASCIVLLSRQIPQTTAISYGVVVGLLAFLGLSIPHGRFQNTRNVYEILGMSFVVTLRCALIAAPLCLFLPWFGFLTLFGSLSGLCYVVGKSLDGVDFGLHARSPFTGNLDTFAKGYTEWGEVFTGATIGFGFGLLSSVGLSWFQFF